jgi:hypothetical protein
VRRALGLALLALAAAAIACAGVGSTFAAFTAQTTNSGSNVTAAPDFRAPTLTPIVIQKTTGGSATGSVRAGGTYRVYATVADTGSPASGVASVTANVSTITPGQTAAAMAAGTFTIDGVIYNRRSNVLTAQASLPNGTRAFTVTGIDAAGNSATTGGTVLIDNTAATGVDVQTANGPGNVAGRAEEGDSIIWTFSEPIQPASLLGSWTGAPQDVNVRIFNNSQGDRVEVYNGIFSTTVTLGTLNLGRTDYVGGGSVWFFNSTMTMSGTSVTIVLGQQFGTSSTAAGSAVMVWTPSDSATDNAGNPVSETPVSESGPADREF